MLFVIDKKELLVALNAIKPSIPRRPQNHRSPHRTEREEARFLSDISNYVRIIARTKDVLFSPGILCTSAGRGEPEWSSPAHVERRGEVAVLFRDLFDQLKTFKSDQIVFELDVELLTISSGNQFILITPHPDYVQSEIYPYLELLLRASKKLGSPLPVLSERLGVPRSMLAQKFGVLLSELAKQLDLPLPRLAEQLGIPPSALAEEFDIQRSVVAERLSVILSERDKEAAERQKEEFFEDWDCGRFGERFHYALGGASRDLQQRAELGSQQSGRENPWIDGTKFGSIFPETVDLIRENPDLPLPDKGFSLVMAYGLREELSRIEKIQDKWSSSTKWDRSKEKQDDYRKDPFYRKELSKAVGSLFAKFSQLSGLSVLELAKEFGIPRSVVAEQLDKEAEEKLPFPHLSWLFQPDYWPVLGEIEESEEEFPS